LIVSLLDIHVFSPGLLEDGPPLEILEAGTGHGALTLHLARAVHAANIARPPLPPVRRVPHNSKEQPTTGGASGVVGSVPREIQALEAALEKEQCRAFEEWRSTRGAIVHTLDIDPQNSQHAERIIRGFQRGMYAGDVDFHTGDVSEWVTNQLQRRAETSADPSLATTNPAVGPAFLSHIFLDIPDVHRHLQKMQDALHVDGLLVVFSPSITQIATCVRVIKEKKLLFAMDQVVELGLATTGLGSGRQWDVRVANTAAERLEFKKLELRGTRTSVQQGGLENQGLVVPSGEGDAQDGANILEQPGGVIPEQELPATGEEGYGQKMVCRPKVGERLARLAGGGFVAVWRRMRDMRPPMGGDAHRR
jgi:tRNA (adenine57-N1/adenine58-N1)-methyltransferase catalytic subunit